MTEEISETTRLSALLVFTSGFLSSALCVFVMLRFVLLDFGDSIFQNYQNAGVNSIYAMASSEFVTGPEAYNVLSNGLDGVLSVTVRTISDGEDVLYKLDSKYILPEAYKGKMNRLFTSYASKRFVVGIEEFTSKGKDVPYLNVTLVEVN